jgi:hypothetical protein
MPLVPYRTIDCALTAHDVIDCAMMSLTAEWRHLRTDHRAWTQRTDHYLTCLLTEPHMYKH